MRVEWSDLSGVHLEPAVRTSDNRGSFEKLYDGATGTALTATQVCTSFNRARGTLRGLHVQLPPAEESKAIWCGAGEMFDVMLDMRRDQVTYGDWATVRLAASEPQLLRLPPGIAHGYQTLTDGVVVNYLIEGAFSAECARTIKWDAPGLSIDWPLPVTAVSDADRDGLSWPVF